MAWTPPALTTVVVVCIMLVGGDAAFASTASPTACAHALTSASCSHPDVQVADAEETVEPPDFYLECDDGLLFPQLAAAPGMCGSDGSSRVGEAPSIDPETGELVAAPHSRSDFACAPAPNPPKRDLPDPPDKATVGAIDVPLALRGVAPELQRPPLLRGGPVGLPGSVYRPPRG